MDHHPGRHTVLDGLVADIAEGIERTHPSKGIRRQECERPVTLRAVTLPVCVGAGNVYDWILLQILSPWR
jgi:hypothetical protein